jgi:hypothetical protein
MRQYDSVIHTYGLLTRTCKSQTKKECMTCMHIAMANTTINSSISWNDTHAVFLPGPQTSLIGIVMCCAIALINVTLLCVLLSNKSMRRSDNSCILSLCFSDAMIGASGIVGSTVPLAGVVPTMTLCAASAGMFTVAQGASTTHLCLVCAHRCWIMKHGVQFDVERGQQRHQKHTTAAITCTYIVTTILLAIPYIFWTKTDDQILPPLCAPWIMFADNFRFVYGYIITLNIVPHLCLNVMSIWLIRAAFTFRQVLKRRRMQEMESVSLAGQPSRQPEDEVVCFGWKSPIGAAITVGLIVLCHDLLTTPFLAIGLMTSLGVIDGASTVIIVARILSTCNALMNPIIYVLRMKYLRYIIVSCFRTCNVKRTRHNHAVRVVAQLGILPPPHR